MKFDFNEKIKKDFSKQVKSDFSIDSIKEIFKFSGNSDSNITISGSHYILPFVLLILVFFVFVYSLINLQVYSYDKYRLRADNNQFEVVEIKPNRGLIVDRNGKKLAENIPAISVYLDKSLFVDDNLNIDDAKLADISKKLEKVLGNELKNSKKSLFDIVKKLWENYDLADRGWLKKVEILSGMSNQVAVKIKASGITGVTVENGNKRLYPYGDALSHILGYTGEVYAEDLDTLDYISFNDVIGKSGLEKVYDKDLFGVKGKIAVDRGSPENVELEASKSGATLHLSIDAVAQKYLYNILRKGVGKYNADGGAAILENVKTGEIVAMASYPSFDDNLFVGGISEKDYKKVLKSGKNPLLNRSISAQVPPGSTFKTIVASAALDAGAITKDTVYISRSGYKFSNGSSFQEYANNSYGALDLISALSVSSNIYFCETIRNWDMDKLVPYLNRFGIGNVTGIDLEGEGAGRLPSPENKIRLAKTTSPWLDPVWYPEGDSCNSVIGQGITTVTPLQMVNWVSAIANGGTLNSPKLASKIEYADGTVIDADRKPIHEKIAKDSALSIVREGMWASVNGPRRVIVPLSNAKPTVAAKTGTAEFGRLNSDGRYEHTHAWVTGFFPFKDPEYAFVVFLEDGGASNNSAQIAREFINWWNTYRR